MSIQVNCPSRDCDQVLSLSPEMAGKKGKCPACGKSFQIPKKLGGGSASKPASSAPASGAQPAARPASKPAPRRGPEKVDADEFASMLVNDDDAIVDSLADGSVEDYEEYDAAPRRPARRRRRDDDYEDDRDDYREDRYRDDDRDDRYRDEDEDYRPRRKSKGGGLSKSRRWKLTGVGMLIAAISMCVFSGSLVFTFISEMMAQLTSIKGTMYGADRAANLLQIGHVFALIGGVGLIVGYAFCVFVPNKYGSMGLAIATVVLAVINFVMQLIFVQIRTFNSFSDGYPECRSFLAGWGGGLGPADLEVLGFFLDLGLAAQFLVFALFLAAAARTLGDRRHKIDCMRLVWFLTGFAGLLLFLYIFMFIGDRGTGKWLIYIVRILNWIGNGLLGTVFVLYIMNLFYSAKSSG